MHQAGIGVLMDWVPAHFPKNDNALAKFDGTHLFDHADSKQGEHKDWGTRIFNYGRHEVKSFLTGSLMHLMKEYHLDGVRVDAVASMLYLDYSRKKGEWIPNKHGGNQNLEAIAFLKHINQKVGARMPGALRIAEESTAFPGVTAKEGLGFDLKWNMGWMHDTLKFFQKPTIYRKHHLDALTNTFLWAFSEKFVAALSHDEVVYGKKSLRSKMPGDEWQQFANLRLLYGFMWAYPGQKLLFMGSEMGQHGEWSFKDSLPWAEAAGDKQKGVARLIADLNRLYREEPALHQGQFQPGTMELVLRDKENVVLGLTRKGKAAKDDLLFVNNLTEVPRHSYRVGVDAPGAYKEVLNTDAAIYGGSNVGNLGTVNAEEIPMHGKPYSISITLPPLATVAFKKA
jgi:1,4-alpha-glucan branching enzyme